MNSIMRKLALENNVFNEDELMTLAKSKLKYNLFQTFLERKNINSELAPYCDAITIFYKGVDLIEYYIEGLQELEEFKSYDLLNMNATIRKKLLFNTLSYEIFFGGEEHALEVLIDDEHYKVRTLNTRKEKLNAIYD